MKLKITIDRRTTKWTLRSRNLKQPARRRASTSGGVFRSPHACRGRRGASRRTAHAVVEDKVCRSPVSGIVASVTAQPGQTLQVGDVLLVLEAMKMETQVTAPVAGKVAAIKVKAGRQCPGRPGISGV